MSPGTQRFLRDRNQNNAWSLCVNILVTQHICTTCDIMCAPNTGCAMYYVLYKKLLHIALMLTMYRVLCDARHKGVFGFMFTEFTV